MYAVVRSGGKQYRVEAGSTLSIDHLAAEPGSPLVFDRVLLIADGEQVMVGAPHLSGATVRATVIGEELGPKLVVFKFKQKVKYRRRTGHRQHLTRIRIDAILATPEAEQARPAKARRASKAAKTAASPGAPRATRAAKTAKAAKAAKAPKVAAAPKAATGKQGDGT